MPGIFLHDYDLEPLRRFLKLELAAYPLNSQNVLYEQVNVVFQQWKRECATKEDYIGNSFGSLLGYVGTVSDEVFQEADPWLCAGLGVQCRTELAFKLWLEDYTSFMKVLDTSGLPRLFAVLALREDTVHMGALIRVAGMLIEMNIFAFARYFELASKKDQLKLAALAEGRKKGAYTQKMKAQEKIQTIRKFALSYFMYYPGATYNDAVRELLSKGYSLKSNGTRYSPRRILEIISGVKDEALKRPMDTRSK